VLYILRFFFLCLWDHASWYISIVKSTRCTIFEFIEYHSACFGRSFCPSSGVQDCALSIRYMSYRLVDCLLASMKWNCSFIKCPLASSQRYLYDIHLMACVQYWTPDDGRKNRPKHVEWYSIISKIVHLVGFTTEKFCFFRYALILNSLFCLEVFLLRFTLFTSQQ